MYIFPKRENWTQVKRGGRPHPNLARNVLFLDNGLRAKSDYRKIAVWNDLDHEFAVSEEHTNDRCLILDRNIAIWSSIACSVELEVDVAVW